MKNLTLFLSILLFSTLFFTACLPPKKEKASVSNSSKSKVDTVLADELGADEYGMKNYVMAILKKGLKRWKIDTTTAKTLQEGHMQNINRLSEEGKLVVAGPFMDDTETRGIYIFDVKTIEEAQKLCESDPAIQAGWLMMELHPWYGSAALMKTVEIHKKISRKEI